MAKNNDSEDTTVISGKQNINIPLKINCYLTRMS